MVRRSMARLVRHPGQKTSSQGVPASNAAWMVGDQSMPRPVANFRFQRSTTASDTISEQGDSARRVQGPDKARLKCGPLDPGIAAGLFFDEVSQVTTMRTPVPRPAVRRYPSRAVGELIAAVLWPSIRVSY